MPHRDRTALVVLAVAVLVVVTFLLVPTGAGADPPRSVPLHPADEMGLAKRASNFRRAVAYAGAVERYGAAIYAAVLEQARYDAAQQAKVAAAIDDIEQADEREAAVEQFTPQLGAGRCGGDLPPCSVMMRESGGSLTAQNPNSTASGKWQFLDSTWQSVTGLSGSASDYSEEVQDQAARELWAGGSGCSNWSETGAC